MLPVPQDRLSGRRSSSIVSRTFLGRRASVYATTYQDPAKLVMEINGQLALFRDLLIHIGQPRDCPELREKVRRLRRSCVEATKRTGQLVLPGLSKDSSTDLKSIAQTNTNQSSCNPQSASESVHQHPEQAQIVLLYFMAQLLLRELARCHRLVQLVPMDMSAFNENRAGPSNFGNVISQILLCKQITPDFNQEELCSIAKDSQDITRMLDDLKEYLPVQENSAESHLALQDEDSCLWSKTRRGSFYKNMGVLCCVSKQNYL